MSQHLSMIPTQSMRLEQRLTPQLIQSMEILQLPLAALEARVRAELESNPVLEEIENTPSADDQPAQQEVPPRSEANDSTAESFDRLDRMSRDLELDPGDLAFGRATRGGDERDAKLEMMANTASRGEGLREQLLRQWALVEADEDVREAGEVVMDWIDDDGYLRTDDEHLPRAGNGDFTETLPLIIKRTPEERERLLDSLSMSRTPPIRRDVLAAALRLIRTLEPTGVGSCDLTECLLTQLQTRPDADPLCETLIRDHLVDLARNRFPEVAKATHRSIEDLKDALKLIGKLNHRPGLLASAVEVPHISPDLIIDYADDGDGYTVRLARGSSPRLRISANYRKMLQNGGEDKAAREFIRKRIDAANTIIDAIHFRRERVLELGRIIVERQREFFDYGPQFLKVLRMRDLAEELGCDPSTISRTVDGKYVQAPRGIFPLRMFFTGGTENADGESISWDSVKAKVQQVIEHEDKAHPLSDDEVAARLVADGVQLSRRTVAKYRSQLGIPTASQRKVF